MTVNRRRIHLKFINLQVISTHLALAVEKLYCHVNEMNHNYPQYPPGVEILNSLPGLIFLIPIPPGCWRTSSREIIISNTKSSAPPWIY